jgi:uncharacterized protein YyaL (SSP411 family)
MRLIKLIILIVLLFNLSCNSQNDLKSNMIDKHKFTNSLINETSPYLLQHANNPVDWYPWNDQTLEKAKKENKLLLISVGYSACHWCHVMEHESFEDEQVAKVMNDNFICIKIDREERPDIDQIYMTAVHLMNQRGGWPLNCIALPDGRPFWGGTYFRKNDWVKKIKEIANIYANEPDRVIEFSNRLTEGIQQVESISLNKEKVAFPFNELNKMVENWSNSFDNIEGGSKGSPKFPMPNAYMFLLDFGHLSKNNDVLEHVQITLDKMAFGGIYDQMGGGFSRYSVDKNWKAPHFEKMLYDNAQLVSLYSNAFIKFKKPLYKDVVFETLDFVERELMSKEGVFYSALDADSEGEEGKFYVWSKQEIEEYIKDDQEIFMDYYNINNIGLWEHGNYILLRKKTKDKIARKYNLSINDLDNKINSWKVSLNTIRDQRIRPGLDDKSLTSWNSLMISGFVDAYMAFGKKEHLSLAVKSADFLLSKQLKKDGGLWHSYKNGRSTINGFLEDYALTIEALIKLYEATLDEKWLITSKQLVEYSIENFYDQESKMFYFTSKNDTRLVARKLEVNDNVIPASNSVLANTLYDLGVLLDNAKYMKMALTIVNNIRPEIKKYTSGYANYGRLMLKEIYPFYEVAVVGSEAKDKILGINNIYNPNKLFTGSLAESPLELLRDKYVKGKTMIYVCEDKACQLPTQKISQAQKMLK